jgi:hypothetical protein
MKNKERGPSVVGGWAGGRGSSFAVTSEWGRGRGKLCHRKRPVDDRMTWSSGSSQRKTSGVGGDLETLVTGNHQCTLVLSFTHDEVVVSACEVLLLHRKMRSHVCATNCATNCALPRGICHFSLNVTAGS